VTPTRRHAWATAAVLTLLLAVAATLPVAGAGARSRHTIALGAYVGSADHPGRLRRYSRAVGRDPLIAATYKQWRLSPFPPSELRPIWRGGAVPLVTWEPWTYREKPFPLGKIAAGRYDGYLRSAALAARRWGHPILLRFAHEMNGNWYPWGRRSPRTYKAAWRHIVRIFRANGASNVKWVWTPYEDSGGRFPFRAYYPGDSWVDWVGLDGFNWGGRRGWHSFGEIFGHSLHVLSRLSSRPAMIAETGSSEIGGSKRRWVRRALTRELPRLRQVRALVWFSRPFNGIDMRVDSSSGALRALRRAIRLPVYDTTLRRLIASIFSRSL
jgi:Glycosyl hydrolase family 26